MTPTDFDTKILRPGLAIALPLLGLPDNPLAPRFLLAIAYQESGLSHRFQVIAQGAAGPARGWWQFERGGVLGLMKHAATQAPLAALCAALDVRFELDAIWRALEGHDALATGVARLLLRTHPAALPTTENDSWLQYLDLWRPGKPDRARWTNAWAAARSIYG